MKDAGGLKLSMKKLKLSTRPPDEAVIHETLPGHHMPYQGAMTTHNYLTALISAPEKKQKLNGLKSKTEELLHLLPRMPIESLSKNELSCPIGPNDQELRDPVT